MKISAALIAAMCLTGCATLQRLTNTDHMTTEEREVQAKINDEARLQAQRDAEAKAILKAAIRPGLSLDRFIKIWGGADSVDAFEDTLVLHYENDDRPIEFYFRGRTLLGWKADRAAAAAIENRKTMDRELARQRVEQAEANYQQSLQNFGNTLQNISTQNQLDQIQRSQRQIEWQQRNSDGRSHVNPY